MFLLIKFAPFLKPLYFPEPPILIIDDSIIPHHNSRTSYRYNECTVPRAITIIITIATMSMSMYWKSFLRAIGARQSFRRTGPSSILNLAVAAGIGIASGHYIFKAPLEEYWSEQNRAERERQQQSNEGQQQQQQQQLGISSTATDSTDGGKSA